MIKCLLYYLEIALFLTGISVAKKIIKNSELFLYRAATNTHLLTEREKNKQTSISLLFNRLLYVTFLYEIKEGRETFPTHLFDFVLFSSVDFTCCSWNLWNLETMYSRSLNYSRRGISDPNSWLRYPLIFFSLSATVSAIFTVGAKCMKYRLVISIYPCDKDADNATSQLQHQIALSAEYSPQPAALLIHFSRFSRLW